MRQESLASTLRDLDADLRQFTTWPYEPQDISYYQQAIDQAQQLSPRTIFTDVNAPVLEKILIATLGYANRIVDNPRRDLGKRPQSLLGRMALDFSGKRQPSSDSEVGIEFGWDACLATELQCVRALMCNAAGDIRPDAWQAIAVVDGDGQPLAYAKNSGLRTAISLRQMVYETRYGPERIPAGAIFELDWTEPVVAAVTKYKASLVVVDHNIRLCCAGFLRFSTIALPPPVRKAAADIAALLNPKLQPYAARAAELEMPTLQHLVAGIIRPDTPHINKAMVEQGGMK
jgi:hypothetical protein